MDVALIQTVRKNDVLYNMKSMDYNVHQIRQDAWESIAKELKIPAIKAKERWNKLRRCYCNARNRRMRNIRKGGAQSKNQKPWKYDKMMSFILPFLDAKCRTRKSDDDQQDIEESSELSETVSTPLKTEQIDEFESQQRASLYQEIRHNEAVVIKQECAQQPVSATCSSAETSPRKRAQSEISDRIVERNTRVNASNGESGGGIFDRLDDTDMFFLSMSRRTKRLPKMEQAQIKLVLSNAVLSAEMRCNQRPRSATPVGEFAQCASMLD